MSEQSALLAYFHHAPERILVASPPVSLQSSEAASSWWTDFLAIPVTDAHRLTPRHEEGHVSPSAGMWMPGRQLPLGKVIKQFISFWGYLIVQPAPKSLAALCPTETGSHSRRRDRAPDCQSLETTGSGLPFLSLGGSVEWNVVTHSVFLSGLKMYTLIRAAKIIQLISCLMTERNMTALTIDTCFFSIIIN